MSSDNFHLVVQQADGTWRASRNHSMSWWMEISQRSDHALAMQWIKGHDPQFASRDEALKFCESEYSEYGCCTFEHPDAEVVSHES